jgi:succinate dehydrogenase/fumarate reductase flavoprotein subunit
MEQRVIIIGAGLAGMMAAYAAQAEGVEVLLIDKGPLGLGTNSALANGVFACPTADYSQEAYVEDTIQVGRKINEVNYVHRIALEAPKAMTLLRSLGLDLKERRGQFYVPTPQPEIVPGRILVKTLAERILALKRITVLRNFYVTELLNEGSVTGLKGFDESGREIILKASAVILATGGAGAIYLRNDNQRSTMGQGYALAAKAGLSLWDMEFVQFYPLVLNEPRLPSMIVYPPYPDDLRLINAAGEDLLKKWQVDNINKAAMTKRDEFSVLLYEEGRKGPVYMDCRRLPESAWENQQAALFKKVRFDFKHKPVAVSPAAHFFMGGVRIDQQGQTTLPGLFACGEIVWGFHGANRRGGNALTECAVMGKIAGRQGALYAKTHLSDKAALPVETKGETFGEVSAFGLLRDLRQKLREAAWNNAGIIRSETGINQGLMDTENLHTRLDAVSPHSVEERRQKEDLLSGVLVTKAILTASQARQESRGSFIRQDFPQEDDQNWLKNSCLTIGPGRDRFYLSYEAVAGPNDQPKVSASV